MKTRVRRRREDVLDDALAARPDGDPTPEEAAIGRERDQAVERVLAALDPRDAATLRDYMRDDRPDVPPATFRKRRAARASGARGPRGRPRRRTRMNVASDRGLRERARRAYERGRLRHALSGGDRDPSGRVPRLPPVRPARSRRSSPRGCCPSLVVAMLHRGQDWGAGRARVWPRDSRRSCFPIAVEGLGTPALCELLPWFCAAGGMIAGLVLVARRRVRLENPRAYWISAALVALLAGAVGCWIAGAAGLAGLAAGLAVGAARCSRSAGLARLDRVGEGRGEQA